MTGRATARRVGGLAFVAARVAGFGAFAGAAFAAVAFAGLAFAAAVFLADGVAFFSLSASFVAT